ncbi:unnamed protein product [Dracunculus medinensis]|uniref:Glyoxalase domain-containing protein 4 n=1 Tax=Dracunculus medinensis TaxID=318479 RepID=A0A0N4UA80_DRAME|nr:unnamed protein product [Dracunculus medinensis]
MSDPDGHCFFIKNGQRFGDPVYKIALNTNDLKKTVGSDNFACLKKTCHIEWKKINDIIDRGSGFGRIAFAITTSQLGPLQEKMRDAGTTIEVPLVRLDTPGKATVEVVIFVDPNGHEICFVGEEAFCDLSKIDTNADALLKEAILVDESDHWFKDGKPGNLTVM